VNPTGRSLMWAARALWLALAVTGDTYSSALAGTDDAVGLVVAIGLFAVWAAVLLALFVPSAVALTATRLLVPLAPVTAVVAIAAGAELPLALATVVVGVVATLAVCTAEFGETFIQASAYGAERRIPLRPPGPLTPIVVTLWAAVAAALIAGPLLVADRSSGATTAAGLILCVVAAGGAWLVATRSHHLARRWLVVVPAGLVIHDRYVLADTVMVPRRQVHAVTLAPADTEAADLTGGALGAALEITLADLETVVLAPDRRHPGGRALHVRSVLVSPSRPGRALRAWLDG
jgi:hypothetical protein